MDNFIEKAVVKHGDKYDYSKVNYLNSYTKVVIICREHGEFEQNPSMHLQGRRCKKCGIESRADKRRKSLQDFIDQANEKHDHIYDYSKVVYTDSKTKVIILCLEHGEFQQNPNNHLRGQGCPKCGDNIGAEKRRKSLEEFVKQANEKHNYKYDYSKVKYINSDTKVIINCSEHGDFYQIPSNHLSGQGCPICANNQQKTLEHFIYQANEIHNHKYDYSKVEYINDSTKVIIVCKEHGEFKQSPSNHLQCHGCPTCGIESRANKNRKALQDFINQANEKHKYKYDYSKVDYKNNTTKVIIICKEHGEFEQAPSSHLSERGCPKCCNNGYSKSQIKWLETIMKSENIYIQHAENDGEYIILSDDNTQKYKVDGYCKETNTVYEFHGCFWHGCQKCFNLNEINNVSKCSFSDLYKKTLEKEQFIREQGYNLIIKWEHEGF